MLQFGLIINIYINIYIYYKNFWARQTGVIFVTGTVCYFCNCYMLQLC